MADSVITSEPIHVVIIGAGLAGLATALATKLSNPSHRVTILETVKELQEIGVGILSTQQRRYLSTKARLLTHLRLAFNSPQTRPVSSKHGASSRLLARSLLSHRRCPSTGTTAPAFLPTSRSFNKRYSPDMDIPFGASTASSSSVRWSTAARPWASTSASPRACAP